MQCVADVARTAGTRGRGEMRSRLLVKCAHQCFWSGRHLRLSIDNGIAADLRPGPAQFRQPFGRLLDRAHLLFFIGTVPAGT